MLHLPACYLVVMFHLKLFPAISYSSDGQEMVCSAVVPSQNTSHDPEGFQQRLSFVLLITL